MQNRRAALATVILAVAASVSACGGGSESASPNATTAPSTTAATTATTVQQEFVALADLELSEDDLWAAFNMDLDSTTIRFTRVTESGMEGLYSGSTVTEGAFDVTAEIGSATLVLAADVSEVWSVLELGDDLDDLTLGEAIDMVEGQRFQYRVVDDVFWIGIPSGDGVQWIGLTLVDVEEMGMAGRSAVDGGEHLVVFADAIRSVEGAALVDGSTVWEVVFEADEIGSMGAGAATVRNLFDAGFDGLTGFASPGVITVDPNGFVTRIEADITEWWTEGVTVASGTEVPDVSVLLDIVFWGFGDPVEVEAPCENPTLDGSQSPATLVC